MIFKRSFWIAAFLMVPGFTNLRGSVITWTNVSGGSWSAPLNWDLHVVPGSNDFANITVAGTYTVTADVGVKVYSLTLGGASGLQTLTNNSQTVAITNTLITANGIFGFGGGTLAGGLVNDQGAFDWGGGTVANPMSIAASGTLNFDGAAVNVYGPLTNAGTINWSGSTITIYNNNTTNFAGAIYNQAGALFNLQSDQTMNVDFGTGFEIFNNAGTVRKTAASGTSNFAIRFTNASTGTVDAQSGTIQFSNGGNIGGAYNTAANATIQFVSGSFVETGTVTDTGTGLFRLYGATVTLNDRIPKFLLASGNVALSPTFQGSGAIQNLQLDGAALTGTNVVTGTLGLDGGGLPASSPLTVLASGVLNFNGAAVYLYSPLTNAGTVNWSGSTITVYNNNTTNFAGIIYNQSGGLFSLLSDQSVSVNFSTGFEVFNNAGTVRKVEGSGTSTFSILFTNTGTVDAENGAIHFNTGGNVGGTYNTASGAAIEFNAGSFTQSGAPNVTGSGSCRLNGATITLNDQIPNLLLTTGNVALSPAFQTNGTIHNLQLNGAALTGTNRVTGTLGLNGGGLAASSPLTVSASGVLNFNGAAVYLYSPLTNAGTVNWSGSTITVYNNNTTNFAGVIYNQAGGLFSLQSDQNLNVDFSIGFEVFNNAGTVRKIEGLGTTTFNILFTNTGTVDVESGAIHFNTGGNVGGTYNTASGAVIEFDAGSFTQSGAPNVTGSGLCRLNGATVTLSDRIPNFLLASGNVALIPTFQTNGTIQNLQLDGAVLIGTNVVTGTLGFNGGGLAASSSLAASSPLTVTPSGILNFNGAAVSISAPLTNAGIINWSGGTITVYNNAGVYTGAIYNQMGGLFNLQSDQALNTDGLGFESINNAGTIRKTAALGTTTINVPFTDTGALDAQSGSIRMNGPYLKTGGVMNCGITSLADFGKISFQNTAPLTGIFSVNFNGGYYPSAGDSFVFLTYGAHSGTFTSLSLPSQAAWQSNYAATTFTLSVLSSLGGGVPLRLAPLSLAAGTFTLQISGDVGPSYILQASTDLINWTPLSTNRPSITPFTANDPNAGNFKGRFYRVLLAP